VAYAAEPQGPDPELAALGGDRELARTFFAETFDHLGSIQASVLALEHAADDIGLINEVFRPFHSLKANAAALGISGVETVAHRVETLLDQARSGARRLRADDVEVILAAIDLLTQMLQDLDARLNGAAPCDFSAHLEALVRRLDGAALMQDDTRPAVPEAKTARPEREAGPIRLQPAASVKVDTRKLDALIDLVGELAIVESMVQEDRDLRTRGGERLQRNLAQLHRITSDLQRGAIAMRLVPIRQTFQRMARVVRDFSVKAGKPVTLTVTGEEIEVDRHIAEELADPLMHMLRNGVDHGIEDSAARVQAGKAPEGRLSLHAFHQGPNVVIRVADDGRGLDEDKLRRKAIERGLLAPSDAPTAAELHELVFQPGISTADLVTEMSGRGIGMDVVRRNVQRLRGRIEIETQHGKGTAFVLTVPLTLATIEGLIVRVGEQRFVLPTFSVREALECDAERVHQVPGDGWRIEIRDRLLPLTGLRDLFDLAGADTESADGIAVVLEDGAQRIAMLVDQLLGKQDVVMKPLGAVMNSVRGVSGGAILADGRVSLILDVRGLMELHRARAARAA
jgi:two-component system chemotaxis sensor kinase CheA